VLCGEAKSPQVRVLPGESLFVCKEISNLAYHPVRQVRTFFPYPRFKWGATLAVTTLVLLGTPSFAAECLPLPNKVEKLIKSYADEIRGVEYCEYRTVARGDIDADGVEDLAVVFNVEGACNNDKETADDKESTPGACGNHHESFMKVFLGKSLKEVPMLEVGARGVRTITSIKIVNGAVEAKTLAYGKDDALCCPSVKGKAVFILKNGVLTEKRT